MKNSVANNNFSKGRNNRQWRLCVLQKPEQHERDNYGYDIDGYNNAGAINENITLTITQ